MDDALELDQMTADEIVELLAELGRDVGEEEALLLRELIVQVGGVAEALEVLDELADELADREAA
jgi:hypothetical protein